MSLQHQLSQLGTLKRALRASNESCIEVDKQMQAIVARLQDLTRRHGQQTGLIQLQTAATPAEPVLEPQHLAPALAHWALSPAPAPAAPTPYAPTATLLAEWEFNVGGESGWESVGPAAAKTLEKAHVALKGNYGTRPSDAVQYSQGGHICE